MSGTGPAPSLGGTGTGPNVSGTGTGPNVSGTGTGPRHRRRTVLWACVVAAVVVGAIVGVAAASKPASQAGADSSLKGKSAPPISGPGRTQAHLSLAQFRHRWVLVEFTASWCVTCQQEMPQLLRFSRQHPARDVTVLSVEEDPADFAHLRTYLSKQGAHWPLIDDPAAQVAYGVTGLPSLYLVAPDGTVLDSILGQVSAKQLDGLLRQGASAGFGAV